MAAEDNPYFNNSGYPIPRLVSLRSNKVYMRAGPGPRYPIKWIYTKAKMPIEIVQEFDTWRKVRDFRGVEGWMHQSLLSGKRSAVVKEPKGIILLRKPEAEAKPVAMLEESVIVGLKECNPVWCKVEAGSFKGWVEKKSLWGVYEDENLD